MQLADLATEEEILRLHTPEYVERIKRLSAARGGGAGEMVPFGAGAYEIACLAVGGVITAVDAVLDATVDNEVQNRRWKGFKAGLRKRWPAMKVLDPQCGREAPAAAVRPIEVPHARERRRRLVGGLRLQGLLM
jgi:histone deacetylase-like protein